MSNKSKEYSSSQEEDENIKEEENEEESHEDYGNGYRKNVNKKNKIKKNKEINKENKTEKNTETKINIIMNETEKDKIIIQLKKELNEREHKIKTITKTNNKLQQSLEKFSKQIDEKIFNEKGSKNFFENLKNKKTGINYYSNDKLKERELNNAINMIKILRNDNDRLQSFVDNYEKDNKLKDLENINREKINENNNLENQIKDLKEQLSYYMNYAKKYKELEKQIEILNKENKYLKDNIKSLNNQINKKNQKNENLNSENKNFFSLKKKKLSLIKLENSTNQKSIFNKYKININPINRNTNRNSTLNQNSTSLPSINTPKNNKILIKNNSLSKIFLYKKNYKEIINDILPIFFSLEEIELIEKKIFKNNSQGLEAFKLKLCIINKSKETLNNKYNNEIKKYKERLSSSQEQIEYLNTKIKELEVNCQVLQTKKNEDNISKRLLQKKIKNLEKNLEEKDNILKLGFVDDDNNINNETENKENESQNE